ncbi:MULTISPECIES: DUF397 domain-containing protein [unclassified Nocardia]|uniref:DUF397 domain-containing protein n=1 Tax=unclassified Nocardia TaxID=2637762 RepID=UPI00278BDE93|nr:MULTISPECIES: DUF397 domain-containing protein [unclassified Nocardia]
MVNGDLTGAAWFKSSYSEGSSQCVEVAWLAEGGVGVRDSKDPAGPTLMFAANEWDTFTAGLRNGTFQRRGE